MSSPDLSVPGRYHVVGAGGAGMSAIATVLAAMGHDVTGSDARGSAVLTRLRDAGVETWAGHEPERLAARVPDAVAASTAVPADDPELGAARSLGVPLLSRADILSAICATRRTLAVAGTHGKTTTSSMLAGILVAAGMRPSYIVGGDIAGVGPGARWDDGEWLVVEADESDGTFLRLGAEGVVVTSIEPDHLDYFGDVAHMEAAFEAFAAGASGQRVICADGAAPAGLAERIGPERVATYGRAGGADLRIEDVRMGRGGVRFRLEVAGGGRGGSAPGGSGRGGGRGGTAPGGSGRGGGRAVEIALRVPGVHNALNASGALGLALAIGVEPDVAVASLEAFGGVARRFEHRGSARGVSFVDDYGHLPGEVKVSVEAAAAGGWSRVVAVFQPHRYSRTEALWQDFADSFAGADVVVITDVYPAGEAPRPGISGELIAQAVSDAHPGSDVRYVADRPALVEALCAELREGDLCFTLGAGDITTLPTELRAAMGGGDPA